MKRTRIFGVAATFGILTACAGQNFSNPSAATPTIGNNIAAPTVKTRSDGPTVYAESWPGAGKFVEVFADGGALFSREIEHGGNVVADPSGYLYILHKPVGVYADAGKTLVQQFTVRGSGPLAPRHGGTIATDGRGHVYVLGKRNNREHLYLYEYQLGTTEPIREFNVGGVFRCMTTDSSGNLYLALGSDVSVYAPGSTTPERTIHKGLSGPYSMTVDPTGNLYVANITIDKKTHLGSIVMYAPGDSSPSRTITDGVLDPFVIHTDSSGDLGVLNGRPYYNSILPNITIYAPGSSSPLTVITQGIDVPTSFAFDSSNNLYVSNHGSTSSDRGSITVYAAGSYSPARTITKNITYPDSVAVGP